MRKTTLITAALTGFFALFACGCGPRYPNCEKDNHCKEGEYCVNGLCRECRDNQDCPENMKCARGACRGLDYCDDARECAEGQVCRDSRCSPCIDTSECPSGKVCLNGLCKKPECITDEQCPAGLYCKGGACVPQETAQVGGGLGDCKPESIYFDFDSTQITSSMRRQLDENYECTSKSGGHVVLEGHCDPRGTTEYNMGLGDRRARTVKNLLKTMGADPSKLRVVSKGEEEAVGHNEESWAKDRRVDFE